MKYDLKEHLVRQQQHNRNLRGIGKANVIPLQRIDVSVDNVRDAPLNLAGYAEVFMLILDAAMLAGFSPDDIVRGIEHAQDMREVNTVKRTKRVLPADRYA